MAKLPQLIDALTACDERDRPTLDHIARVVREAGHLPTTKRGSGASEMSFHEAAAFLIAASVAEAVPKIAADVVPQYRSLKGTNYSANRILSADAVARIDRAGDFGEALERLIELAPSIRVAFEQYIDEAYGAHDDEQRAILKKGLMNGDYAAVEVTFHRPTPFAVIRFVTFPMGKEVVQHEWRYRMDIGLMERGFYSYRAGDAVSTRTIGLKTLLSLCSAIRGDLAASAGEAASVAAGASALTLPARSGA